MDNVKLPFQNPHVTLLNDTVLDIDYRGKNLKMSIPNIRKIYLSKRKTGYLSALVGNLFITRTTGFKLYICTDEKNPVTLNISNDDKFYFVSLISWVRTQIKEAPKAAPTQIKRQAALAGTQAVAA